MLKLVVGMVNFQIAVEVDLHGFSEASASGCDCCIYMWYCDTIYSNRISLAFSQCRIAPVKT